MTVKELINILKKVKNKDKIVLLDSENECFDYFEINTLKEDNLYKVTSEGLKIGDGYLLIRFNKKFNLSQKYDSTTIN